MQQIKLQWRRNLENNYQPQHSAQKTTQDLTQQLTATENEVVTLKQQIGTLIVAV